MPWTDSTHATFQGTLAALRRMCGRYPAGAGRFYVEDKANSPAVIDALRHELGGIIPVLPEGGQVRARLRL